MKGITTKQIALLIGVVGLIYILKSKDKSNEQVNLESSKKVIQEPKKELVAKAVPSNKCFANGF